MLNPIAYFSFFGIIETIQGAHQITGNPADPFKVDLILRSPAIGAFIANDARVATNRIAIDRMINRASI